MRDTLGVNKKGGDEEGEGEDGGYDSAYAICALPSVFFDWKIFEGVDIVFEHCYLSINFYFK
jgi:hypothetical protein